MISSAFLQFRQILQYLVAVLGRLYTGVNLGDFSFRVNQERVSRRHRRALILHRRPVLRRNFSARVSQQFESKPFFRAKLLVRIWTVHAHAQNDRACFIILGEVALKIFQRDLAKYDKTGAVILGVSVDSPDSHKEFCSKEGLTFKLLADPGGKVSAQYGSTMQYQGTTMAARNTFLINPEGKIAKVYTGVKPAEHSDEVLKDLAELKKS